MAMSFWAAAGFAGQSRLKAEERTRCPQRVKNRLWLIFAFGNAIVFGGADPPRDKIDMPEKILLALSTFPDGEIARRISNQLVTERFAACANILSAVESIYRWKNKIESGNEILVFFKITEERQTAFQDKLRSLHPYDVPEIVFVPVEGGLPEYLRWVSDNCG